MSNNFKETYHIKDTSNLASPSLLVYPAKVKVNLEKIKAQINIEQLRPHIKTIKCKELVQLQLDAGITKFKCATLKEVILLLELGAKDVLIAYPLVANQMEQLLYLIKKYPNVKLQGVIDHLPAARLMDNFAKELDIEVPILIDVNLGMGRTGVAIHTLADFHEDLLSFKNLKMVGFHGYDGHIREVNLASRVEVVERYFQQFLQVHKAIEQQ
ncbi:MAG: alanine racemase, partial [Sphingobacterium sp.]